jgi:hypothetical protein
MRCMRRSTPFLRALTEIIPQATAAAVQGPNMNSVAVLLRLLCHHVKENIDMRMFYV